MSEYPPEIAAVLERFMAKEPTRRKQVPKVVGVKAKVPPAPYDYKRKRPQLSGAAARYEGAADRNAGLAGFERKSELRRLATRLSWLDRNGRQGTDAYRKVLDRIAEVKGRDA